MIIRPKPLDFYHSDVYGARVMAIEYLKNIIEQRPVGRVLMGLDVGKKTIGVALSDSAQSIAMPLCTIKRKKFAQDMAEIERIIRDYDVGGFVIGLPLNMDGSEGPRCQSVRDFAAEMARSLQGNRHPVGETDMPSSLNERDPGKAVSKAADITDPRSCYPAAQDRGDDKIWIALWDERLSTASVEHFVDEVVDINKRRAKERGILDKLAAQHILQGALECINKKH